jgi:23S rRNA pseudoU1915 N3-methylase RlmH
MADQSLQAFQLGASLFDRAQTQQRMMEQFQMQLADQQMRKEQADLQNKIQLNAYNQALDEQSKLTRDYGNMQTNLQLRDEFFRNPKAEFPKFLPVESKANQNVMFQISQQLDNYAPRARLQKSLQTIENKQLSDAADIQELYNVKVVAPDGSIDQTVLDQYMPRLLETRKLKDYSQDVRAAFTQTDKNLTFDQRIGEAMKLAKERGKSPTERTQERNAELAISEYTSAFGKPDEQTDAFIRNNALTGRWKTPEGTAEKRILGDETISNSASMLADQLENFEKKFGAGAIQKYVGLIDGKVEELKRKISSAKTEEEKQAYALLQRFQSNFNTVAFEKSGKAVTSQEMERLKAALGNIQSNNFADDVRNFASLAAEDYYGTIRSLKDKYRITPTQVRQANELVAKYKLPLTPFGQQQQAAPAAVSQEQSISPQDVFKNIRANRPQGGTIQPTTPPASNRVGRFEMFIEGQ